MAALSILAACLTILANVRGQSMASLASLSFARRLAQAIAGAARYLWMLVHPVNLAVYYPLPEDGLPLWLMVLALAFLMALSLTALGSARCRPYILVGWSWYLLCLTPVSGLFQTGGQAVADRFMYLPALGLYLAMVWWLGDLLQKRPSLVKPAAGVFAGVVIILFLVATWQVRYWSDSITLFRRDIEVTGGNSLAYANLGTSLVAAGRPEEGIIQYRKALDLTPDDFEAHYNLGLTLSQVGDDIGAARHLGAAVLNNPRSSMARFSYGLILLKKRDFDGAAKQFLEAARLNPAFVEAQYQAGVALAALGSYEEAAVWLAEAVRRAPDYAEAHYNLGVVLMELGRRAEADSHLDQAARLDPRFSREP